MKPFFIAGVQRSGTTLLSVLLGKHGAIYLGDSAVIFRLMTCFKNYAEILPHNLKYNQDEVLAWLIKNDHKGKLKDLLDYENIGQYSNIKDLIHQSIRQKLTKENAQIFGDKAPNLQHYIPDLLMLFPEAKIIHIIRDGRAVAHSMNRRAYKDLKLSAQSWVDGNILALANQKILGTDQYKLVFYEHLLEKPAEVARELCDFLKIPFEENMLQLNQKNVESESKQYVKSNFDTSKIKDYQKQLSAKQIRKIERIQGPLLRKFGYELMNEYEEKYFRQLSVFQRIVLNTKDNFKLLFKGNRKGMRNRKNIEYHQPLRNRIYNMLFQLTRDLLSRPILKSIFERTFFKQKYYKNDER